LTTRDDLRVQKALQGADFPADRSALLSYAETRAADAKTMQALRALPDRQFGNMQEVVDVVPQEPEGAGQPGGVAR
jgi:hypothetical protein